MRQLRQTPRETLLEVLPALADELGDFTIEHLQCRVSDVAVARRHQRDGLVLIGDAYQTPCPAAGTGISRLLVDVERLTVHATRWFAANDTSAEALRSYYNDAVKRRSDRAAIRVARFRRAISTNASPLWALQRQIVKAKRFAKYILHSTRDLIVRSGQVMPRRAAKGSVPPRKSWLLSSPNAASTGMTSTSAAPDVVGGATS